MFERATYIHSRLDTLRTLKDNVLLLLEYVKTHPQACRTLVWAYV